jgi:hypothetical protein
MKYIRESKFWERIWVTGKCLLTVKMLNGNCRKQLLSISPKLSIIPKLKLITKFK